jgi:TIR domain
VNTIFLSYSSRDYFFAEILAIKLDEAGFKIWRDQGSIRAGDDWRQSIDDGIEDCFAVVVALSASSAESAYVTYEWAYAVGMSKPVIPLKLSECKVHPRLEPTHYIDFSYPRALPWDDLIARLKEVEVEKESTTKQSGTPATAAKESIDLDNNLANKVVNDILGYLNSRGFTMVSFERLRERVDSKMTDKHFDAIIESHPTVFRHAQLKGGKPGIAKRVP